MPRTPPRKHPPGRSRALYEEFRARIADGSYAAGAALPSTRALAAERGLSRATVSGVYEQLAADGFIDSRPGAASRVAAGVAAGVAAVAGLASPAGPRPQGSPQLPHPPARSRPSASTWPACSCPRWPCRCRARSTSATAPWPGRTSPPWPG